jgi:hypothetical protein
MKPKYYKIIGILILLFGAPITLIGAMFKLQHWAGSTEMMLTGLVCELVGAIILIYGLSLSKEKNV